MRLFNSGSFDFSYFISNVKSISPYSFSACLVSCWSRFPLRPFSMSSTSRAILLPFLLAAVCSGVRAQDGSPTITAAGSVTTIPAPNGAAGWCYYCSDDNAPPLCNSQCTTAINRLCGENLNEGMTSTEQDCEIQYVPPKWPFNRNGARPNPPSETDCLDALNGILSGCGKDAGTPASGVNASYCTTSGGGGTFGWNDDGSVVPSSARYVIKTKGTDQCGQAQAPWQQATSVIQWDPSKSKSPPYRESDPLPNDPTLQIGSAKTIKLF